MNPYLRDAGLLTRRAVTLYERDLRGDSLLEATLLTAVGVERVLKGILYAVNPIYVLKAQDFKHSIQTTYRTRLLPDAAGSKELADTPDADVLSFRTCLLRASLLSKATAEHKSLLFALSNYRDIVAHCDLSHLDIDASRLLLLRDVPPLLKEYATECNVSASHFFGGSEFKVMELAAEYQEDIDKKVRIKLDLHRQRWELLRNTPGYIEKMQKKIETQLATPKWQSLACPACNNDALVRIEPDFVYEKELGEPVFMGMFVTALRCLYCKLRVDEYREIDHLRLNDTLREKFAAEAEELDSP